MSEWGGNEWGGGEGIKSKENKEEEVASAQWTHKCERLIQKSLSNHHRETRPDDIARPADTHLPNHP